MDQRLFLAQQRTLVCEIIRFLMLLICYLLMIVLVDRKTDGFQDEISPDIKK